MAIQLTPEDFKPCFRCGVPVLLVAYWDEVKAACGEVWVDSIFEYPFQTRDFKDRLVVHEMDKAMACRHDLTCTKMPPPEENGDKEPRPYQGPRSKKKWR